MKSQLVATSARQKLHWVALSCCDKNRLCKRAFTKSSKVFIFNNIRGSFVIFISDKKRSFGFVISFLFSATEVDGGYSKWSMWSLCSATCGVGVKVRSRTCSAPPQRKGGKACSRLGKNVDTEECNEGECPTGKMKRKICIYDTLLLLLILHTYWNIRQLFLRFQHLKCLDSRDQ